MKHSFLVLAAILYTFGTAHADDIKVEGESAKAIITSLAKAGAGTSTPDVYQIYGLECRTKALGARSFPTTVCEFNSSPNASGGFYTYRQDKNAYLMFTALGEAGLSKSVLSSEDQRLGYQEKIELSFMECVASHMRCTIRQ